MSHSAPSESSTLEPAFLVGTDLVEFDRPDLPIYHTPEPRWTEAGLGEPAYGAPLDRLFGEPGDLHLDGIAPLATPADLALGDDPLVALGSLADGLMLPTTDLPVDMAVVAHGDGVMMHDAGSDAHVVAHLHDGWSVGWGWDAAGTDWTFDFRT